MAARSLDNVEILVTTLSERDVDATVQGLVLGGYRFAEFRSAKTAPKDAGLQKVTLLVGDKGRAQKEAMERAAAVATAVVTARDFVNTRRATCSLPSLQSAQRLWQPPRASRWRCSTRRS